MLSRVELRPSCSRVLCLTCLPFIRHCYCAIVAAKVMVIWITLWWQHLFPTLVMQFSSAFLQPFFSDQADHPILGYGRQMRDAWYAQQLHTRVRKLMEPLVWTLGACGLNTCPPIAGTKHLEIGSNLDTCTAVQYSNRQDAQSSLGTVSDTSTESS